MNAEEAVVQPAAEIDWQAIHESIQVIFASLADVVQNELPFDSFAGRENP